MLRRSRVPMTPARLGPQRGRPKTGSIDFSIGPQPAQGLRPIQSAYRNTVENNMRRNRNEKQRPKRKKNKNEILTSVTFS